MPRTPSLLVVFVVAAMHATASDVVAQTPAPASAQKSLAATTGVYVFPGAGQNAEQQSKEEAECYQAAVQKSGIDPFEVAKQEQQLAAQSQANAQAAQAAGTGAGARGAARGAAAGAVVGAIADDTGKGAAIGAGVGLVAGRSRKRQAEAQAQAHADQTQQIQQVAAQKKGEFKKAFGACLEAKHYVVKF